MGLVLRGQNPGGNCFIAHQSAKMSSKDMQLLLLVAFFLPKVKFCSLNPIFALPSCMHMPFCLHKGTLLSYHNVFNLVCKVTEHFFYT